MSAYKMEQASSYKGGENKIDPRLSMYAIGSLMRTLALVIVLVAALLQIMNAVAVDHGKSSV
jgi:hypothetical protein